MDNSKPLISLIIPTRERADTLLFSIRTALDQKSEDYEVIIGDNFSQDNTKEVVESFKDSRLVYVNSGKRLSMCDNFEFALQQAKGKYVIFIGDDDAVMPGAIDKLQNTIKDNPKYSVYCWRKPIYIWPNNDQKASVWYLPFTINPYEVDLRKRAKFVIKMGGTGCGFLPSVYHSAVERSILATEIKQTGRVFHSTIADIFTSFVLPVFTETAFNVGYLVTVTGQSPKSNSVTTFTRDGQLNARNFLKEYGEYKIHKSLFPGIDPLGNLVPDTILVAMDIFPQLYGGLKFNYNAMWARKLQTSRDYNLGLSVGKIIKDRNEISKYHNFSVIKFIYYCIFLNKLPELYRQLLHKTMKVGPFVEQVPNDISAFVNELDSYEKNINKK